MERAQEWVDEVVKSGKPMELRPMNAADRRTIHKMAGDAGLETESVGEGHDRHIVLKPSAAKGAALEDDTETPLA
jgi:spoIIIJ-associated protein